jgi:hypothetical protein
MKINSIISILCAVFLFTLSAAAQQPTHQKSENERSALSSAVSGSAKVGVVLIGSAAKGTWAATKFVAGRAAKPMLLKGAPKAAKFVLRSSGFAAKRLLPLAVKLSLL